MNNIDVKINNIAAFLPELAKRKPFHPAIFFPLSFKKNGKRVYVHYTYRQLNDDSDLIASGLIKYGFKKTMRTILMVKPSLDFFAIVFALFKAGIVPVIIDPGLEKSKLKKSIETIEPEGFIGIPLAHVARIFFSWGKRTIKKNVTVGKRLFWNGATLNYIRNLGQNQIFSIFDAQKEDVAAILFTSGSTGIPKGTVYFHDNFIAQVNSIRQNFSIQPGEIDLPTFPLFALFDPALEMTSIIPDMDFSKPGKVDPSKLLEIINDFGPTTMFASPALLDRFGRYLVEKQIKLPSIKRIISAGASVQPKIISRFRDVIPSLSDFFTPYGATESLPVSIIDGKSILENYRHLTQKGHGICVGKVVDELDVKIIRIFDSSISQWTDDLLVNDGEIGEIVVKGSQVTKSYYNLPEETNNAKIYLKNNSEFYHRMGDLGYFDSEHHLWYCGRKSQRVVTKDKQYFTENCEGIFNSHECVYRSGLIGISIKGENQPLICIELEKNNNKELFNIKNELKKMADMFPQTRGITRFVFCKFLPVDIRHNAKILREKLTSQIREKYFS